MENMTVKSLLRCSGRFKSELGLVPSRTVKDLSWGQYCLGCTSHPAERWTVSVSPNALLNRFLQGRLCVWLRFLFLTSDQSLCPCCWEHPPPPPSDGDQAQWLPLVPVHTEDKSQMLEGDTVFVFSVKWLMDWNLHTDPHARLCLFKILNLAQRRELVDRGEEVILYQLFCTYRQSAVCVIDVIFGRDAPKK